MIAYIIRRLLYAIPILVGVNVITFTLFFIVNSPDDMARMHLGAKRVTPEAVQKWKEERGYDKPLLYNEAATGAKRYTDTIFYEKSVKLFAFFAVATAATGLASVLSVSAAISFAAKPGSFVPGLTPWR